MKTPTGFDVLCRGVDLVAPSGEAYEGRARLLSASTLDSQSSPITVSNRKKAYDDLSEAKALWAESRDSWSTEEGDED